MPQIQLLPGIPSFGERLAQALGGGLGEGISGGIQDQLAAFRKNQEVKSLEDKFTSQGYPEELAKLAAIATTGGQTEILKNVLEQSLRRPQRRSIDFFAAEEEKTPDEDVVEFQEEEGLTPKEKVKREEGRFSKQSEKYSEFINKESSLGQEQLRLNRLQELNESGELPEGLGRLNVNIKSGELIAPFLASADSQEFVKIVNDFLAGAKDTFGARVTNFEVNRFLRRLPSLLNTEEGRKRVLHQMQTLNKINQLHNNSILNQFDKAGGVRKIDLDVAERRARKEIQPELKRLQKQYNEGFKEEKKAQVLTSEIAQDILKQAKGDKDLARKIAKQKGYEF